MAKVSRIVMTIHGKRTYYDTRFTIDGNVYKCREYGVTVIASELLRVDSDEDPSFSPIGSLGSRWIDSK